MILFIEPLADIDIAGLNYFVELVFDVLGLSHSPKIQEVCLTELVTHIALGPFSVGCQHGLVVASGMVELLHLL